MTGGFIIMNNKIIKNWTIEYAAKIIDSEGHMIKIELESKDLISSIDEAKRKYIERQSQYEVPRTAEYLFIRKRYRPNYTDGSKCKLNKYASNIYSRDLITKDKIAPNKYGERTSESAEYLTLYPENISCNVILSSGEAEETKTKAETELACYFYRDNNIDFELD